MNYTIWDDNKVITNAEKLMLLQANIPEYQWQEARLIPEKCDEAAFNKLSHIREKIMDFCACHYNLLICGKNLGCGKTEWALKMMLTYFEKSNYKFKGVDVNIDQNIGIFCQTVPFLVDIKQFGNNAQSRNLYERLKTTELAVFDDIAAVPMSNYDYNILYALVETRLFSGLPCIFTSNATTQRELQNELGPRLAERIWKTSKIIELKGEGHRGV